MMNLVPQSSTENVSNLCRLDTSTQPRPDISTQLLRVTVRASEQVLECSRTLRFTRDVNIIHVTKTRDVILLNVTSYRVT